MFYCSDKIISFWVCSKYLCTKSTNILKFSKCIFDKSELVMASILKDQLDTFFVKIMTQIRLYKAKNQA